MKEGKRLSHVMMVCRERVQSGMIVIIIWLTTNLIIPSVIGQPTSFTPVAPDILSSSFARCFIKDNKGFIWIGTSDGLIRYDGTYAFRYTHSAEDPTSITHSTINTMVQDKSNRLWIGTAQGLCIYDRELDNFINVDSIKGNRNYLNNRYITDLDSDSHGNLWIGTHSGGINVYDPAKQEFTYISEPLTGGILPSTNFVTSLLHVDDVIWCSTRGGILLFNTTSRKRLPLGQANFDFAFNQVIDLIHDKIGNIWLATSLGEIVKVIPKNGYYTFQKVISGEIFGESPNRILALSMDQKGNILLGGEDSPFTTVDIRTGKVTKFPAEEGNMSRLPTNSIFSIYTDPSGKSWIGTFNNGAYVLSNTAKTFSKESKVSSTEIELLKHETRSVCEDADGNVWMAINGLGISRIDAKTRVQQSIDAVNKKLGNKNVSSLICDRQGQLWLGTFGNGVCKIDPFLSKIKNYPMHAQGFGDNQVYCLYEDKAGTIWAGTIGSGIFRYDTLTQQFVSAIELNQPNHIPNTAYVTSMMEDSQGTFWVATLYGLYRLTRTGAHSFSYHAFLPTDGPGSIEGGQIHSVLEDRDKNLWVGTADGGLSLKEQGKTSFKNFNTKDGMLSNSVRSILDDRDGNLWIAGNRGLSKLDTKTKTFTNYTSEDGIRSENFYVNASLKSSTGEFFFGSNKGFNSFYPDSIKTSQVEPELYFSDLKINNQSVRPGIKGSPLRSNIGLTKELKLSYDQRSFVIDFAAIDHTQSSHTYCYKLQGFDREWNCSSSDHSATYTNIDPGHYVFLVKAMTREGVWSKTPIRLEIFIDQVVWKSWWAICLYVLIIVILIYVLVKIRVERLKMKNQIHIERIAREQEHALSESKTQFFTNISHEFRTPLSLVLMPLEGLMNTSEVPSGLRERIFAAYKNANRMMRLVNELMDFNKLDSGSLRLNIQHGELIRFVTETSHAFNEMADRRNIKFELISNEPIVMGWFDRDKLERIIFNVLSNAFKFTSDGGQIQLVVGTKHAIIANGTLCNCIELVIIDNGIGISADEISRIFDKFYQAKSAAKISSPGTGIGLSLTKALVELHQGRITVESIPDHATTFTILLPIEANAHHVDIEIETPTDVSYTNEYLANSAGDNTGDTASESGKSQILVVEDNYELREYLVAELKKEYVVLEASDGEEGLAIALEKTPDLIISDIMMPKKDGTELCHAIKNDIKTSHIPFILLTAKTTIQDQIGGVKSGADLYITKPFNINFLIAHVQQIVASRHILFSRFSQDVYLMPGKIASTEIDQAFLQKAIDYIVNNLLDSQLSVDSIADLFNLGRMQVYRKIKALTGKSVVEFIRMIRVKQAVKLMDTHKFTLSEIAYQTGFSSSSYFTRCFKEEYGKTPSEYLHQT
jgi:signal transduction histidine kinase/ligand-binding sensor domain-containing protein/AraC-like DNA-binding protein/ActR/RegA family two-component response regulator